VHAAADALIHIEVTIDGSTANGGTQNGTGLTDANHNVKDQWTVAPVSATTTASVRVWALLANGVATGHGSFDIHPATAPCPTAFANTFNGIAIETAQVGGNVKKTCDAGVSGTAVFQPTFQVNVIEASELSTTITAPAGLTLPLDCNGTSKALPVLPVSSTITLHESTLPAGAAAASDTTITIDVEAVTTTIHNARAAAVATPTPTPVVVLPATGQPASTPGIPWPAFALLGLIAVAGAGLILRRRS
jgi:MYXO-CTERM domain-containing protein